jgi:hypothetical protein
MSTLPNHRRVRTNDQSHFDTYNGQKVGLRERDGVVERENRYVSESARSIARALAITTEVDLPTQGRCAHL